MDRQSSRSSSPAQESDNQREREIPSDLNLHLRSLTRGRRRESEWGQRSGMSPECAVGDGTSGDSVLRVDGISQPDTAADSRKASQASLAGWASGLALVCIVTGITFATWAHELPLTFFAASATRIAFGQVWVLPASALIADQPVLIGLAVFGVLALAT